MVKVKYECEACGESFESREEAVSCEDQCLGEEDE